MLLCPAPLSQPLRKSYVTLHPLRHPSILFALAAICIRGDLRQMEHEEMMVKMKQAYPSLANTISAVSDRGSSRESFISFLYKI